VLSGDLLGACLGAGIEQEQDRTVFVRAIRNELGGAPVVIERALVSPRFISAIARL